MPVWRCPHCGIPQPETARCWVCHRSTTSCGTCRHFRRGIAGGLGLCGLDARRLAVAPAEVRPCWMPTVTERSAETAGVEASGGGRPAIGAPGARPPEPRPRRTFVPVDQLANEGRRELDDPDTPPAPAPTAETPGDARPERRGAIGAAPMTAAPPRWSLWGDLEG